MTEEERFNLIVLSVCGILLLNSFWWWPTCTICAAIVIIASIISVRMGGSDPLSSAIFGIPAMIGLLIHPGVFCLVWLIICFLWLAYIAPAMREG